MNDACGFSAQFGSTSTWPSQWAEQPNQALAALARRLPSEPPAPDAADKELYTFMHGSVYAPVMTFILICMFIQIQLCSSLASYNLVLTETL